MPRQSLRLLLGSGAFVLAAAVTTGAWANGASAGTPVHKANQSASHWFTQIEPAKGQTVFLRNGSTAPAGRYEIAVRVTSRHHGLSCFAERRGDGQDLGRTHAIAAGDNAPVILATAVPAGTQYNLICLGTTQSREVLNGTITETSQ